MINDTNFVPYTMFVPLLVVWPAWIISSCIIDNTQPYGNFFGWYIACTNTYELCNHGETFWWTYFFCDF